MGEHDMSRTARRGVHTLTMHTARTRGNLPVKVGAKQSSGSCSCDNAVFVADRADEVRAMHAEHVAKIEATGKGTTIIGMDVRVTAHYSTADDDPGFTDSIFIPLAEWDEMSESERNVYVADMVGQRIAAEQERRDNPPPEPTLEEKLADHERSSLLLQEEWFRNEAARMQAQREALSVSVHDDEALSETPADETE